MLKGKNTIALIFILLISIFGIGLTKILVKAEAINVYATFGGSKNQVTPGDNLQYVLTVRNDGTQTLNNVLVREHFLSGITLIAGTTKAEKNSATIDVPDNWTST